MPLKGLGLLSTKECSEKEWEQILKEVEATLARSGYDFKTHPWGDRWRQYETIQYTKRLTTTMEGKELELLTDEPKVGMELGAVLMSIEYVNDILGVPHKINFKPYCWGWDVKWCENGMAAIDLVLNVFAQTGLFKCTYYCTCENQDFVTEAECEKAEEQAFGIAILTNPNLGRTIIALANKLEEKI